VRVDIITIFPEYFGDVASQTGPLGVSLIGKAAARGDITFRLHNLRRWTTDVHHTVDDTPFGGGPGMVMKPDVWGAALDEVTAAGETGVVPRLVLPSPSGVPFTQDLAALYAAERYLVFGCGRYEGIDSRVAADARSRMPVDEVSIGDYVLAGGEAAVAVILEAVCRLLPGVLGNERSISDDSFGGGGSGGGEVGRESGGGRSGGGGSSRESGGAGMRGLLEGPVYTRPRSWRGLEVPDVLLSGNHAAIARWQRDEALLRTAAIRPDLLAAAARAPGGLSEHDLHVLSDAGFPVGGGNMAH
jgi:tRNA (guanine37-N1)-methyltransferase